MVLSGRAPRRRSLGCLPHDPNFLGTVEDFRAQRHVHVLKEFNLQARQPQVEIDAQISMERVRL